MADVEHSSVSPRFEIKETLLFPNGLSILHDVYQKATVDYLTYYPNFRIDIEDRSLQRAKLGAAVTVLVNTRENIATRSDLAKVISDMNYPDDHILAVPKGRVTRLFSRGKLKSLDESTIRQFAQQHAEEQASTQITPETDDIPRDVSVLDHFCTDLGRLVMYQHHRQAAGMAVDLEHSLLDIIEENKLKGASRSLAGAIRRTKPVNKNGYNLNELDDLIVGLTETINRLNRQSSLGDRALDQVNELGKTATRLMYMRGRINFAKMADSQYSTLQLVGTSAGRFGSLEIQPPRREIITPTLSDSEREALRLQAQERLEQQREKAAKDKAQRAEETANHIAEIDARNAEIVEHITRIANEYNLLTNTLYVQKRDLLRDNYVIGNDSLVRKTLDTFGTASIDAINGAARLYLGLATNANEITNHEELMELTNRIADLKAVYDDVQNELLPGGSRYELPKLTYDLPHDLLWLDTNFEKLYTDCIIECQKHVAALGEPRINRVITLLGRSGSPDNAMEDSEIANGQGNSDVSISEADEDPANAADHPKPTLADVRALSETVDWTIMPTEQLTLEGLKDIICGGRHNQSNSVLIDKELLDERLQMILDWRQEYDAQVYYSSDKMMDETGNFYFVLSFEKYGKEYAIAENPVYGNATYVIARHLMPLLDGETLRTVVKELQRKSIRALSGKQIIHRQGGQKTHPEKITAAIEQFATEKL